MNSSQIPEIIAVSTAEMAEFGCPHCGYRSGFTRMSSRGSTVWECADTDCGKTSVILAEGVTQSSIGAGDFRPELQSHPRRGTPAHGAPDLPPESGGEFFYSRGIGLEGHLSCFCCGGTDMIHSGQAGDSFLNNIAAFVQCKEAGERVVQMFDAKGGGARLDYREYEPDRVQVKVGACNEHLPNLKRLDELVCPDGIVTEAMVDEAKSAT